MQNSKLLAALSHMLKRKDLCLRSLPCILGRLKSFIRNTVGEERPFRKLLNTLNCGRVQNSKEMVDMMALLVLISTTYYILLYTERGPKIE